MFFNDRRDSATPLFVKSKVLPLNPKYCQSNLMHDVVNKNCPDNLLKMFSSVRDTHSHCTRSSPSDKLHIQLFLNMYLNCTNPITKSTRSLLFVINTLEASRVDPPLSPSIFLALKFYSSTDWQKLWHNCSLFVNASFDTN